MFGLLNINKPPGLSSHDVVARVRRMLGRKSKVGHSGTLDPFATGVLVLAVGPATRLCQYVAAKGKQYVAEVTFGRTSTTDDPEGQIVSTGSAEPRFEEVQLAAAEFVGEVMQVPPAYSAVHVDGRRAYKLARRQEQFELPRRKVRIDAIEVLAVDGAVARLKIDCGSGVYIRSIARDLGEHLGCGGYCSALTRTRVGAVALKDALILEDLSAPEIALTLAPARLAVDDWPSVTLAPETERDLRQGKTVEAPVAVAGKHVAALDAAGVLVALCRSVRGGRALQPMKVFPL